MDPGAFAAAGLYDAEAPNAADRLALLAWLTEQGFSVDEIADAAARRRLTGIAGDRVLRPGEIMTLAEFSTASGLSPERVEVIRRASGLPPEDPEARAYSNADVDVFLTFEGGAQLLGERSALGFSRVMGNALARVAETAVSMFLTDVEAPLMEATPSEVALAQANLEATELLCLIPQAMDTLFRVHIKHAIQRSQEARKVSGSYLAGHVAVGFVDLVGFTPLTQQLEWRELAAVIDDFEARANDLVAERGGRVVKLIGDEVMFVAGDAKAGCQIALDLFDALRGDGSRVTPRGGIAVGNVLTRAGDYYGRVVNLASRIADLAVPDEVLVSMEVRNEAADAVELEFEPAGRRLLKGFDDPVELWSVRRR